MWANLLFLFIVTVAASDDEDEFNSCKFRVFEECHKDEEILYGLPGSEEELEEFCKYFQRVIPCISSGLENCDNPDFDLAYIRDFLSNVNRICDEDSLLRTALIEQLPCLKYMEDLQLVCYDFPEEDIGSFTETLTSIGITDVAAPDSEPNRCLGYLYRFGCIAAHVGKSCNNVARGIIIDISQGFDSLFATCRPGMKENLLEIAKVMQAEEEKIEEVEEKIRRKK